MPVVLHSTVFSIVCSLVVSVVDTIVDSILETFSMVLVFSKCGVGPARLKRYFLI